MNRQLHQLTICLSIGALFLTSCTGSTPEPTISFHGRLIVADFKNIYEIKNDSSTGQPILLPITNNPTLESDISLSPNNRYILYTMGLDPRITSIIDLQTGEINTIVLSEYLEISEVEHQAPCISWAPDGSKFSFPGLGAYYVYDLSKNRTSLVMRAPKDSYTGIGGAPQKYQVTAEIGCGFWIGADRFVLQRFSGDMPPGVTFPNTPEVDSNATTLVQLTDGSPQLVDFPDRWFFEDICKDESHILLRDGNGAPYITQNFAVVEDFNPIPLPACSDCENWSFMPDNCNLFSVKQTVTATGLPDKVIGPFYFVDATSLQIETGPSLDEPFDYYDWFEKVFVGDSKDLVIPIPLRDENFNLNLMLFDLDSGTKVTVMTDIDFTRFLAWLP